MEKNYNITFSYTDNDGQSQRFDVYDIQAQNRQQAINKAFEQLSNSFFVLSATENGKKIY